jgi:hypothetical protein
LVTLPGACTLAKHSSPGDQRCQHVLEKS